MVGGSCTKRQNAAKTFAGSRKRIRKKKTGKQNIIDPGEPGGEADSAKPHDQERCEAAQPHYRRADAAGFYKVFVFHVIFQPGLVHARGVPIPAARSLCSFGPPPARQSASLPSMTTAAVTVSSLLPIPIGLHRPNLDRLTPAHQYPPWRLRNNKPSFWSRGTEIERHLWNIRVRYDPEVTETPVSDGFLPFFQLPHAMGDPLAGQFFMDRVLAQTLAQGRKNHMVEELVLIETGKDHRFLARVGVLVRL